MVFQPASIGALDFGNVDCIGFRHVRPPELAAEEPLDQHGDEYAFDHDPDDALHSSDPGLYRVHRQLGEKDPPVDGIQADLRCIRHLHPVNHRSSPVAHGEEGEGEGGNDAYIGHYDATEAIAVAC